MWILSCTQVHHGAGDTGAVWHAWDFGSSWVSVKEKELAGIAGPIPLVCRGNPATPPIQPYSPAETAPRSGCCWAHWAKQPHLLPLPFGQILSFLTGTNGANLSITNALCICLWAGHEWYLQQCALLLRYKPRGLWKGQFSHVSIPQFCSIFLNLEVYFPLYPVK